MWLAEYVICLVVFIYLVDLIIGEVAGDGAEGRWACVVMVAGEKDG